MKDFVFPYLSSYSSSQMRMLDEIEKAITELDFKRLELLENQVSILCNIKYAQTFDASVQVNRDDLKNIFDRLKQSNIPTSNFTMDFDERKWALEALHINYDPRKPIEEYLDVVKDRQKKVTELLTKLLYNEKGEAIDISQVAGKIAKINHELVDSKSIELFTCSTSFLRNNSSVITSMLLGGLIGYSSANFLGCTVGGATGLVGSIGAKLLSKEIHLDASEFPKNTTEWLKNKVENSQERIIASLLSKDLETIQVWNIRRNLNS